MATKSRKSGDFLTAAKAVIPSETLHLADLGRDVVVRGLSVAEMRQVSLSCLLPGKRPADEGAFDNERLTRAIVAASVRDADGSRLIPADRVDELQELPSGIYSALQGAAMRVNGMAGGPEGN